MESEQHPIVIESYPSGHTFRMTIYPAGEIMARCAYHIDGSEVPGDVFSQALRLASVRP